MKYMYWLGTIMGITPRAKHRLMVCYDSPREIYDRCRSGIGNQDRISAGTWEVLKKSLVDEREMEENYQMMLEKGIKMIPFSSEEYPERLRQIPDPPFAIYCLGELPMDILPSVAMVGARECTPYGEKMAFEFGRYLAGKGVQVISGMARGIDGASQRGALSGEGKTYGILGCGVDICYPRENRGLYEELKHRGGIISEIPPGVDPRPYFFPMRNRIISGLSEAVLIMESGKKSGSLITADYALEQGREVWALPGQVTSRFSEGCHSLIRQGAGLLLSPEILAEDMGWRRKNDRIPKKTDNKTNKDKKSLECADNIVYSCLDFSPKGIEMLLMETGLPVSRLMDSLVTLQLEGEIEETAKNFYIRVN